MWCCGCLLLLALPVLATAQPQQESALGILSSVSRVKRASGGRDASIYNAPFLVHIKGKMITKTFWGIPLAYAYYYCTGVLLDYNWVMTAAHCFYPNPREYLAHRDQLLKPRKWHFKVGNVKQSRSIFRFGEKQLHGEKIFIYPYFDKYDVTSYRHDVALIRLESSFPRDRPTIQPLELPLDIPHHQTWPIVNNTGLQACIFRGFGCTQNARRPELAQAVELPYMSGATCRARYYPDMLPRTHFCAGAYRSPSNIGICQGDSGGPLACQTGGGEWRLAGIASYTHRDQPSQYPGAFVNVRTYAHWIRYVMDTFS